MSRRSYRVGAALLLAAIAGVYRWRLSDAPIYLAHDEVIFALNAHQIAFTGRDLAGDLLPLYVHVTGDYWLTAAVMYLGALFQRLMPLSEVSTRLPAVAMGLVDVVMMYFAASRIFGRKTLGVVAAALLALTPAHFIHSRLGVDHLFPVAFQIAWLMCLSAFVETRRTGWLVWACLALGCGAYTYLAAVVVMPIFFVLTCAVLLWWMPTERRSVAMGAAAFVLALAPLGLWLAAHPSQYGDHVRMYSLYSPSLSPLQGVKDLVSYTSLTARADVYWDYFNPSFLFFAGDSSLINSTRHAGVFPFAFALLVPAGLWRFSAIAPDPTRAAIAVGFVLSPVAAVLVGESHRINRALVMLPFVALLATAGFEALRQSASRWSRLAAVAAVLAVAVQFTTFARDYFGDYRVRSSGWFERNIRGGIEAIISRDRVHPVPAVYLSNSVPWVDAYWRFYQLKHEGDDARSGALAKRPAPTLFDPRTFDADGAPPGAVVLADAAAPPAHASALHEVGRVAEPNGSTSFILLER